MNRRWRKGSQVQTLLFDQSRFTVDAAKRWAREHGFKYGKVDRPTGEARYIRLRQAHPDAFTELRTVEFGEATGIKAVVGPPRTENPMQRRYRSNPTDHPVRFYDTEFASGQEPEVDGAYRNDDFSTIMETSFDLTGSDVARMLNKQRRVLGRALENLTETQAFYALVNSKQGQEVLVSFIPEAKRLLEEDIDAASDDPGIFRAQAIEVDWYEDGSYEFWQADVDPTRLQIRFTVELEVIGTWETR